MTEQECLELIHSGDADAYDLLYAADPKFIKRFNRTCETMKKLMDDVQKHFPDACYYTGGGGFNLMLGSSHANDMRYTSQPELVAIGASNGLIVGDGSF